jgi:purine nucleosidase
MTEKYRVVIFSDPGIDDSVAIAAAVLSMKLDIAAAVGVVGNVAAKQAAKNLCSLFELFHLDVPVFAADKEKYPKLPFDPSIAHGADGLGNIQIPKPKRKVLSSKGLPQYLRKLGNFTLISLGPLTALAELVRMEPREKAHIHEIIMMGGAIAKGNVTARAEFNVFCDPEATNVIIQSGIPIRLIPLDVTEQVRLFPPDVAAFAKSRIAVTRPIVEMLNYYFDFHEKFEGFRGCYVHDPLTIVALLFPELFSFHRVPVMVDTRDGPTRGMTMVDLRYRLKDNESQVSVAYGVIESRINNGYSL